MADSGINNQTTPAGELITAYEKSGQQRTAARRSISLLIFGMVLAWVLLLWSAFTDFRSRLPEFISALGREASDLSPKMSKDLEAMVTRLYPCYTLAFQKMIERDTPVIEKEAKTQLAQLDAYAQDKWPLIESGLANIAVASEDAVREEFTKILTEPEAEKIASAYAEAVSLQSEEIMNARFKKHIEFSENIGTSLSAMMATEPDMKNVGVYDALGMMLELAGIEMQKGLGEEPSAAGEVAP